MFKLKTAGATYTGLIHQRLSMPCQDSVKTLSRGNVSVIVLADGAGSRSRSDVGATIATQCTASLVCKNFEEFYSLPAPELTQQIAQTVTNEMAKTQIPLYDLACTMLFFAAHRDGRYIAGHIGDGVIIKAQLPDGEAEIFSNQENDLELNQSYYICRRDAPERLRIQRGKLEGSGVILMTSDGASDYICAERRRMTEFAQKTARATNQMFRFGANSELKSILKEDAAKHSIDDLGFAVLTWR